jgi:hypothetical protein
MKAKGIIKITEELTLTNPSAEVEGIRYSWNGDNKIYFEFIFTEDNSSLRNSRTFEITNTGGGYLSGEDIWNKLIEIPALKKFDTVENKTWIQKFIGFFK